MRKKEFDQGFVICECCKFAYVFRANVLRQLPDDYHGELCPKCNLWVVSIEKLKKEGTILP
jgi:hypothetical protein